MQAARFLKQRRPLAERTSSPLSVQYFDQEGLDYRHGIELQREVAILFLSFCAAWQFYAKLVLVPKISLNSFRIFDFSPGLDDTTYLIAVSCVAGSATCL